MEPEQLQCKFCTFACGVKKELVQHQMASHQNDPNFRVNCTICRQQFKTFKELKLHLKTHGSEATNLKRPCEPSTSQTIPNKILLLEKPCTSSGHVDKNLGDLSDDVREGRNTDQDLNPTEESDDIDDDVKFYLEEVELPEQDKSLELQLQEKAASFLSHIKDSCVTTQKTVDAVVKKSNELIVNYNLILEAQVLSNKDEDGYIDSKVVQEVFKFYRSQNLFEGLKTKYQQDKYRKLRLSEIEPLLVVTKYVSTVTPKGIIHEVPSEFGYSAPFLVQLEEMLNQEDILFCVRNPVKHTPGELRTPLDGSVYQDHLKDSEDDDENLLCFGGYMDDVQPGDSLTVKGSGLSVRSFQWVLLNIHPWLRSSLRCINILALVLKKYARKNGPFLEDFINGLKRLKSKEGVTFNIRGKLIKFRGVLIFWVGDTPASCNVAGFKESPGQALFPCRQCLVKQDGLHEHSCEVAELMRNAKLHEQHLKLVCPTDEEREFAEEEQQVQEILLEGSDPSVSTGVNTRSPLLDLKYFDVTISFPQDIMHILSEGGVLDVTTRMILSHALEKKLPMKRINSIIEGFHYGDLKKDKPGPIKANHLDSRLRQSASQLFLLVYVIPFVVKGHCDEPQLRNFMRLLAILNICTARFVTESDIRNLRDHIEEFLSEFKTIYGESMLTPKCHFLVHIPTQISLFGPASQHCAMRFEAYHSILKRLYKILHTSKNLCFSLIERLLLRSLHEMRVSAPGKFLYKGHEGAGLKPAIKLKSVPQLFALLRSKPGFSEETTVIPANSVEFHGINYRVGSPICPKSSSALPSIHLITKIYLHDDPILLCRPYQTVSFDVKLNAYELQCERNSDLVALIPKRLQPIFPVIKIKYQGKSLAILKENTPCSLLALQEWKDDDSSSDFDC